jgi:phage baseplate assembly protein W
MAEFLGKGWSFPVAKDERVMRPDFGCAIHDLVFAPNSAATLGMAEHHVRDALLRWEPRIEVLDVTAVASDDHDEVLLIGVHYRVRMTDSRYNLVYPFYLNWAAP